MRYFLLALLIVLLPLRGWVGDAMAAGMAATQVAHASAHDHAGPASTESAHLHAAGQPGPAAQGAMGCAGHSNVAALASFCDAPCDTCGACQVCQSPALSAVELSIALAPDVRAPARIAVSRFTSANRAPGLKPPIP